MDFVTDTNVLRVKLGLYCGLLIFSFFVIIAVPVTTDHFKGICFLYKFGPDSNCNYVIAMAVIFQLLYTIFRLGTLLLLIVGRLPQELFLFGDLFELIYTAIDLVALFLTFIAACILSAGIDSSCKGISNCEQAYSLVDSNAVSRMHTAEAGAWISFILWLFLVVLGVFWLFRQGKIPFLRRPAQSDAQATPSGGQAPNMETPPASDVPKY